MQGFFVYNHIHRWDEVMADLAGWIRDGKLKPVPDIIDGFRNMPKALAQLYYGANVGVQCCSVRGQVVALYYVAINITGLFLGPTTVGWLSTNLFGEANLRWAGAVLPLIFGTIPLVLAPAIGRAYRARLSALELSRS